VKELAGKDSQDSPISHAKGAQLLHQMDLSPQGNTGFVNIATDHDTSAFAVAPIQGWWKKAGKVGFWQEDPPGIFQHQPNNDPVLQESAFFPGIPRGARPPSRPFLLPARSP
jgi:hypothetical protein